MAQVCSHLVLSPNPHRRLAHTRSLRSGIHPATNECVTGHTPRWRKCVTDHTPRWRNYHGYTPRLPHAYTQLTLHLQTRGIIVAAPHPRY